MVQFAGTDDPLLGRVLDNRYRVLKRIGEGAVGRVYFGEHVLMGRPLAIKVLRALYAMKADFRRRFEREARAASKLAHPACVQVIDFGEIDGFLFLIMEFVEGELLEIEIERGPIEPRRAVQITTTLASALSHAHSLGIVHRDIKPGNVMLLPRPPGPGVAVASGGHGMLVCKLLDFGLARRVGPNEGETVTQHGVVFGTPAYISPEQALGKHADPRSDLYSLGGVLFHMLAGRRPFLQEEPLDLLRAHVQTPPPKIRDLAPHISPELATVVDRLLEKDPDRRIASAEALCALLRRVPEGAPPADDDATLRQMRTEKRSGKSAGSKRSVAIPSSGWGLRQRVAVGSAVAGLLMGVAALLARENMPTEAPKLRERSHVGAAPAVGTSGTKANIEEETPESTAERAHALIKGRRCRAGLDEYERAAALDARIRAQQQTLDDLLLCLGTKSSGERASSLLVDWTGTFARGRLEAIVSDNKQPDRLRRQAERALAKMAK